MKLLCEAYTNEWDDVCWTVIDIAPLDAKRLLNYTKLVAGLASLDTSVYCIELWDAGQAWLKGVEGLEELHNESPLLLANDTFSILPDDFHPPEDDIARVDCERAVVTPKGVYFRGLHVDYNVSTPELFTDMLEEIAGKAATGE